RAGGKNTYSNFDGGPEPFSVVETPAAYYGEFRNRVDDKAVAQNLQGKNIYEVKLSNQGGLVMPVILEWTFADGSKEIDRIPAEIWRSNESTVTKVFIKDKEVTKVVLDPLEETTDINTTNNVFPKVAEGSSKFDDFKKKSN